MKRLLCILFLAVPILASATDWYVALEATAGNTNGLSWPNAWTNVDQVKWSSVQAGDTIWISGGTSGETNQYVGYLSTASQSANHGTSGNRISIRTAKDSSHNGRVKIMGGIYIDKNYYTIDGSVNSNWVPTSVLDTYNIYTNCNLEVCNTNNDGNHGVNIASCLGQRIYWVHITAAATQAAGGGADINAMQLNGNSGGSFVNECEVAYNVLSGAWGFGFFALGMATNTFDQLDFHHNMIEKVHDNYIEADGGLDIHDNIMRGWIGPTVGHPDAIQGISFCTRIWNNIIQDQPGTAIYIEPIGVTLAHDIYAYNNFFNTTTQAWHDGFTLTGAALSGPWSVSNLWVFNNTAVDYIGSTVFIWNAGLNATNVTATNVHLLNNAILLSNNVSTAVLVLYTNLEHKNDARGFLYSTDPSGVEVDHNNIHGSVLNASQGIKYGAHGDYYDTGFTNFADFAATYPVYSHNNNTTAGFVSLKQFDFRVGADGALKSQGTNLSAMTNIAPNCDKDILGASRGTFWDIGAYQSTSNLLLWLSGNNWGGGTNITDDSGYKNDGILYMASTNWPSSTNRFGDPALGFLTGPWTWLGPPAEPAGSIQYFAITNLSAGITNLTNGTVAVWAHYGSNSINTSAILDSGYTDKTFSWQLGRQFWDTTYFSVWTNGTRYSAVAFPDGTETGSRMDTGGWHHYAVTWDGTNFVGYYDGLPFSTNSQAGIPSLQVFDQPWIAVGTWKHQAGPALDSRYPGDGTPPDVQPPNCCWFGGQLDDIQIYNRSLSAAEVLSVAFGGGTSSSSPAAPEPPPASTNQTANISGYLKLDGQFQLK